LLPGRRRAHDSAGVACYPTHALGAAELVQQSGLASKKLAATALTASKSPPTRNSCAYFVRTERGGMIAGARAPGRRARRRRRRGRAPRESQGAHAPRATRIARGQNVSVDALVDALWPDELPARPQPTSPCSRAGYAHDRRDSIRSGDHTYALVADDLDIDELDALVLESERRLEAGGVTAAAAAASAALALARGELLPEHPGADWLVVEREVLARRVARRTTWPAQAALALRRPQPALEHAHAALDVDPYDEAALRC